MQPIPPLLSSLSVSSTAGGYSIKKLPDTFLGDHVAVYNWTSYPEGFQTGSQGTEEIVAPLQGQKKLPDTFLGDHVAVYNWASCPKAFRQAVKEKKK